MAQRIKGQEVEVIFILNGVAQQTITDVRNFEMSWLTEIIKEGYLNETTDRYDSVFHGIKGKMDLHFENADVFQLIQAVVDKAQRRTPGTKVNVKATLNFPNGQRVRLIVPNVEFGEFPLNFGGRAEYGSITADFNAPQAMIL